MVKSEAVPYRADGLDMLGTLYCDDASPGPRPGVLLFPEAFGPGPNVRARAERLAGLGYAALACDLYGGGALLDDLAEAMALVAPLRQSPARLRARATGALDALRAHRSVGGQPIAAIGFCLGGTLALELGRSGADIAAIVGFHSGLSTKAPEDAGRIRCPVLVCIGADDPSIPPEQRQAFEDEMRAGGVDWTMHVYGGVIHAFTNHDADALNRPDFARYDARADARSWAAMMRLFADILQPITEPAGPARAGRLRQGSGVGQSG